MRPLLHSAWIQLPALLAIALTLGGHLLAQTEPPLLEPGTTVTGELVSGDALTALGCLADEFTLNLPAGTHLVVEAHSDEVDLVLELHAPSHRRWSNDDASPHTVDPRLDLTLPEPGPFRLVLHTFMWDETGAYTLRATASPPSGETDQ